jgi:hypothetical protein
MLTLTSRSADPAPRRGRTIRTPDFSDGAVRRRAAQPICRRAHPQRFGAESGWTSPAGSAAKGQCVKSANALDTSWVC